VRRPLYDLGGLTAGIVHLGLGGFHRAHMARYTHDLMQSSAGALDWAIVGVGLRAEDRAMHDALAPQDCLYTLLERSDDAETVSVVGALCGVIYAGDGSAALLHAMDARGVRIVSLTVTENGYCLNRATRRLDTDHPLVVHDLATPEQPRSSVGIIAEALQRRRMSGRPSFTALSCDNIQENGRVLRDAVLAFAVLRDPGLAAWIQTNTRFPSTMVDRITPVTQASDRDDLARRHGIADNWPVVCETFSQWVIEDSFSQGRPDWDLAGAQFVEDVAPYEFMKLRLLNTSHLAVAALGGLAGYRFIDEALGDDRLRRYMRALMDRETGPTLPVVPGVDLEAYKARLIERFANRAIKDTVERVNTDAPLNMLLDPIRDRLQAGRSVDLLALALAAWIRRTGGTDEAGKTIESRHPLADRLRAAAIEGRADPGPVLGIGELFGDLGQDDRLTRDVGRWLGLLYERGAAATLSQAQESLAF